MSEYDRVTKEQGVLVLAGNVSITQTGLTGAIIDTAGFDSLTYHLVNGAIVAGTLSVVLEQSEFSDGSTATAVPAGEVLTSAGGTATLPSFTAGQSTGAQSVGDVGKQRFHRLRITGGASADGDIAVVAVLGHSRAMPTS